MFVEQLFGILVVGQRQTRFQNVIFSESVCVQACYSVAVPPPTGLACTLPHFPFMDVCTIIIFTTLNAVFFKHNGKTFPFIGKL